MRMKESEKASKLLKQVVEVILGAKLQTAKAGSLMLASATGSLLEMDDAMALQDHWRARAKSTGDALPAPLPAERLTPEMRISALTLALDSLTSASASAGGLPLDERSHMSDTQAQLWLLLAEEQEKERERRGVEEQEAELVSVESARRAVAAWGEARDLHLASQANAEWEAEPDVELLTSLASAKMRLGQLLMQAVRRHQQRAAGSLPELTVQPLAEAHAAIEAALSLFEQAVTHCDSAKGDSLTALLTDWAQALWDATALVPPERSDAVFILAARKAADSIALQTVPLPPSCSLLGDILFAWAEACGGSSAAHAAELYLRAISQGYELALRVSSRDLHALIGTADAQLALARLQFDGAAAALKTALSTYSELLRVPPTEWARQAVPVHEAAEMRYNAACALALAGREEECGAVVAAILHAGEASIAEVLADEDFAAVRSSSWMQQLALRGVMW